MNTRNFIGIKYQIPGGESFTILGVESYPKTKVSDRYKDILNYKPGFAVAVSYRGTLIPNLTVEGGVARINKIKVGDKEIKGAKAISAAIGIKEAMTAYSLKELKN